MMVYFCFPNVLYLVHLKKTPTSVLPRKSLLLPSSGMPLFDLLILTILISIKHDSIFWLVKFSIIFYQLSRMLTNLARWYGTLMSSIYHIIDNVSSYDKMSYVVSNQVDNRSIPPYKIHCRDKGVVTCRFSMFCQCLIASYLFSVNINAKNPKTNTTSSHLSGLDFPNRINLYEFFILVVSLFYTRKVIQFVEINVVFQSIYVYWISFDSFTVVFY